MTGSCAWPTCETPNRARAGAPVSSSATPGRTGVSQAPYGLFVRRRALGGARPGLDASLACRWPISSRAVVVSRRLPAQVVLDGAVVTRR